MKTVDNYNFSGQKALIRVDFKRKKSIFEILKRPPMKRIIILLVFIGFAKTTLAQLYQPFPVDSAMWREWAYDAQTTYVDNWDYQYFTFGDTLISGNTYHKIFKTGTYMRMGGPPAASYSYINQYIGSYREDFFKHILFCPSGSATEQLLYDFNLSLGDSLSSGYNLVPGETAWVSAVDSILVGGQYHKQYHISGDTAAVGGSDFVQIIEGVGSTFGLLGYLRPVFEQVRWSS